MKRFFMFVIALACMCSCSKNDEPAVVVTPPDGTYGHENEAYNNMKNV